MSKDSNRVAIALITNDRDEILMGQRNDNNRFTNPAGHLKVGEDSYCGCQRELKEETGLDAKDIKLVKCYKKGKMMLYLFQVEIDPAQPIDTSKDPDQECSMWYFIDPNDVRDEMHIPLEENMAIQHWIGS